MTLLAHPYRFFVAVLLGIALVCPARAQSDAAAPDASSYFHEAAQQYLASDLQRALTTVDEGLRLDPGNPRLRALRDKIEQQQRSSQQNDSSAPSQSQRGSSSQEQDEGQQQSGESPSQPDEAEDGEEQGNRSGENAAPQDAASPGEAGERDGEASGLSTAQAMRILRALENQEKQLLRQVQKRPLRSRRIEKEW